MCDKNSLFSATATAVDSAIVNFTGYIVIASSSASSNISFQDAYSQAFILAQSYVQETSQYDANLMSQTLEIASGFIGATWFTGPRGYCSGGSTDFTEPIGIGSSTGPRGDSYNTSSVATIINLSSSSVTFRVDNGLAYITRNSVVVVEQGDTFINNRFEGFVSSYTSSTAF